MRVIRKDNTKKIDMAWKLFQKHLGWMVSHWNYSLNALVLHVFFIHIVRLLGCHAWFCFQRPDAAGRWLRLSENQNCKHTQCSLNPDQLPDRKHFQIRYLIFPNKKMLGYQGAKGHHHQEQVEVKQTSKSSNSTTKTKQRRNYSRETSNQQSRAEVWLRWTPPAAATQHSNISPSILHIWTSTHQI